MKGPFFVREWRATDRPAGRKGLQHWAVVSESDDDDFYCDGLDSRELANAVGRLLNREARREAELEHELRQTDEGER